MKVACFGDVHLENFRFGATINELGVNSRLYDIYKCLTQIADYCRFNDVDLALCSGDMFHVRKQVATQALYFADDAFRQFPCPVLAIPGNHDMASKDGQYHSLIPFASDNVTVVTDPEVLAVRGKRGQEYLIWAYPYREERSELLRFFNQSVEYPDCPTIFLGHMGIDGARIGADFVLNSENEPKVEDIPDFLDVAILGHYHSFQKLGSRTYYHSAVCQHNWGDAGDVRGFVVYDTDTKKLEHIPLDAPKFIKIDKADLLDKNVLQGLKGNFVRINSDDSVNNTKISKILDKLDVRSLEIVPMAKKREERETRLQAELKDSNQLIRQYVGTQNVEELDTEYLIALGLEILQEVDGG